MNSDLSSSSTITNITENIDIDLMVDVQNDLVSYDLTSLVFLLYDVADSATARQQLIRLQRASKEAYIKDLNLLHDWALHAQTRRDTWRYEFLESLLTCRLFVIIRKLGFEINMVKKYFNHHSYLNPLKKDLYKFAENCTAVHLVELKNCLNNNMQSFGMDVMEYKSCELIFLELIIKEIIKIQPNAESIYDVSKLVQIINNFGLENCAETLKKTQLGMNNNTDSGKNANQLSSFINENSRINCMTNVDNKLSRAYTIKNPKRVGVCLIINQEAFRKNLERRDGSSKDKDLLKKTLSHFNFHTEVRENLSSEEIIPAIQNVVQNMFREDDSIFLLCILSHGIEGHVYGIDEEAVEVKVIQDYLDSDENLKLRNIPKVFLIQACQEDHKKPTLKLVADGPKPSTYFLRKSDFLVYWATAPEYEAFRYLDKGSVFVQTFCIVLTKLGNREHILNICTEVTRIVSEFCAQKGKQAQIPIFAATLRKDLYLTI